jgi:hypothetical protein
MLIASQMKQYVAGDSKWTVKPLGARSLEPVGNRIFNHI